MGTKSTRTHCPSCGGFGADSLNGYCKPCKKIEDDKRGYIGSDYPGYGFYKGKFVPDEYGIVSDHYGYERK